MIAWTVLLRAIYPKYKLDLALTCRIQIAIWWSWLQKGKISFLIFTNSFYHGSPDRTKYFSWSKFERWFKVQWVTSMLVTDVGDQMCRWQVWAVGDGINTLRKSPTLRKKSQTKWFFHQHFKSVTIIKSPTYRCHLYHCHRSMTPSVTRDSGPKLSIFLLPVSIFHFRSDQSTVISGNKKIC